MESGFYRQPKRNNYLRQCKVCHGKQVRQRREEKYGREAVLASQREYNRRRPVEQKLNSYLKSRYGITLVEYRAMEVAQDHRCKICRRVLEELREERRSGAAVDHCHSSDRVRGLLCHDCNRGLGCFKDNPELLRAAINYLED